MGMGVSVVVIVVVGMSVGHGQLLYYNITGVYVMAFRRSANRLPARHAREGGHPVLRGLSVQSQMSLEYWIPASAGTTAGNDLAFSRRGSPEVCCLPCPRKQRAQGRPGARCTRGLACTSVQKKTHTSIQVQRRHPAFPAQWFTAYFVLFPVNGFLATVAPRAAPRNLTPAPRRQNHTTSPYATGQPRQSWPPRPPHPTARS